MTVTVLPEPWSPKRRSVQDYAHSPGSTTHVVMHETETVAVSTTTASVGVLAMGLTEVARKQSDLLALGSPPDDLFIEPVVTDDPFGQLIDLVLLAERGSLTDSPLAFEGKFAPSLLRLLMHERLLSVVEGLIFRARPRYAERTETLTMPRGRLGAESLLFSLATGTPRVESTFDELTTDTPILQIMASALRVVASDRLPPQIVALRPGLQTRAVHLLRYLSGVTLIERERALLAAERLWLSPLDQIWKPAVDAALPVLRDWAVAPEDGFHDTDAMLVSVRTEKFWEQCLELALESAFKTIAVSRNAQAEEEVDTPAPWVSRVAPGAGPADPERRSFPDFMFHTGQQVVVGDAKYKLGSDGKVSSSDGYQMFAYSHLANLNGKASDLAVVLYPTEMGMRPGQVEFERMRERTYPLWVVRLPFPTRVDLQSQSNWAGYITHLSAGLRDLSTDWIPHSQPAGDRTHPGSTPSGGGVESS